MLFAFKDAFGCSIVLAGFVTGCKPQGTSAFTAHISLVYGVYLVFHLSGAIPKPAFKKKESCCFVVTYALAKLVDSFMGLRVTEDEEYVGLDISQHGEKAYA